MQMENRIRLKENPMGRMAKENDLHQVALSLASRFPGRVLLEEPMKNYTTYRVGGPAAAICFPENHQELQEILRYCRIHKMPIFLLGSGSNILVHDKGLRMVVLQLRRCCSQLTHTDEIVNVGAGVLVSELVNYCEQQQLAGLDFMAGIPGTVGGALRMNAGAFVGEIGERVISIETMTYDGESVTISRDEAGFGYRRADRLQDKIILGCQLRLMRGERQNLEKTRQHYLEQRAARQPLDYGSCGSVFKRPPGQYAGTLIEQAGCKGMRIGGAMVSPKHANFIVNYEHATAQDIFELIRKVQHMVYQKFKVWLELEVKLVGFSDEEEKKVTQPN